MRKTTIYPQTFTRNDYKKDTPEVTARKVEALIAAMTEKEMFGLLGGGREPECKGKIGNAGYLWGVPRLGVPEAVMYDGPAGVTGIVETTGLPQPSLLGCTWDEEMAYAFGWAAAEENAACSGNYHLAPQVDTIHSPHFMRNKDMKSEDSYLGARLSTAETKATQDANVVATIKHFAVANSMGSSLSDMHDNRVDEQTMHETYLRPFEMSITEGGAGSVMNSYNKVNGCYSTASDELNIEILRRQWGFTGSLMSDWGSVHEFTMSHGMDIEMPYPAYNDSTRILRNIRRGRYSWEQLEDAARHVLYGMASAGLLGLVELDEEGNVKEDPDHTLPIQMEWRYEEEVAGGLLERNERVAEEILEEGIVLLKNEGALPLKDPGKLAVIGLGAKYPICGQQQERSYGRLCRMESGAEALGRELGMELTAWPGIDFAGEPIPAECLFQDAGCAKPGVVRSLGIREEHRALGAEPAGEGGMGEGFVGGAALDEDGETVHNGMGIVEGIRVSEEMKARIGEILGIDANIDFTTGTKNYQNGPEGTAFPEGFYTWETYLRAPESGSYQMKLECIGGNARFLICMDGEWQEVAGSVTRENTQWPWDSVICTPTGMGINSREITLEAGEVYPIIVYAEHTVAGKDLQLRMAWSLPSYRKENYRNAIDQAANADTIVFYAVNSQENETMPDTLRRANEPDIELASEQQRLLLDVAAARKPGTKMIVVLQTSRALAAGAWADKVDAVVTAYHGGQEESRVMAKVLTGEINPSGKLSQTWPRRSEDTPLTDTPEHYLEREKGILVNGERQTQLTEGIFFGYRWYDKYGVDPLFPFGFGLSYTSYDYANLKIAPVEDTFEVSLDVTNTGTYAGDEIVQIYLGKTEVPAYVQIAERQLCGFLRVKGLKPGETRRIAIRIDERSLCYWDIAQPLQVQKDGTRGKWHRALGKRRVFVGASSRDIRLVGEIQVE